MRKATIIRVMHFNSAHKLYSDKLSAEENHAIYSKCCHTHGHNYTLEVYLHGEIDSVTGMVVNISDVKKIMHEKIHDILDHKYLNEDVEFFKTHVPTAENIAVFCWRELAKTEIAPILHKVRLFETERNICEYSESDDE